MKLNARAPALLEELPEICNVADVVSILPVSKATLYRMAEQGKIPSIRVGRRILLSRDHLLLWIDQELAGNHRLK